MAKDKEIKYVKVNVFDKKYWITVVLFFVTLFIISFVFVKNDEIMNLPCVHIFHSNCIKKWMKRQDICPICKNKII